MPQIDRYHHRILELDFEATERFEAFPHPGRFSLTMVTDGSATAILNGKDVTISAPCVLCLSGRDCFLVRPHGPLSAQTVSFSEDFFSASNATGNDVAPESLSVFRRSDTNAGLLSLDKSIHEKLREWFFILGTEIFAQSDALWVCRVKKYLLQILGRLMDLCREQEFDPVNLAIHYICANYFKKISLDELCRQAHTNRISLNKMFQERCGCTAMQYLNDYRMTMAEEILIYTRMNLNEIAHATGFEYDTYFTRQFTQWKGVSPTKFRKEFTLNSMGSPNVAQ